MKECGNLKLQIGPTKEYLARQRRLSGASLRDINKELGISVSSLRRMLSDIELPKNQKRALLTKRKNNSITLNYKDSMVKIFGKIKVSFSEKKPSIKSIESNIIKYILDLLS